MACYLSYDVFDNTWMEYGGYNMRRHLPVDMMQAETKTDALYYLAVANMFDRPVHSWRWMQDHLQTEWVRQ